MSGGFGRTLGHTLVYMAGLVVNRGVAFLLVPVFTRVFTPGEFSVWDLCNTTLLLLFPMLDIGMSSAVVRFYHDYDDRGRRAAAFNTSLIFVALAHVPVVAAGFIAAPWLSRAIFGVPDHAALVRLVFLMASATAIGKQSLSMLRTAERSALFAALNLVRGLTGPLIIIVLVTGLGWGVAGALWGDLIGLAVLAAAGMWVCRGWLRPVFDRAVLGEMLRFALPLVPMGLTTALLTIADRYFLSHLLDLDQMAPYSLGFRVGMLMVLFIQGFQLAWPPAALRMAADPAQGAAALARTGFLMQATLFGAAACITCATPELLLVFAPRQGYDTANLIVPLIAYSYAIHGAMLVVNVGIGIAKRNLWGALATACSCAVKLAVTYWFIVRWGIAGAALSTLLAFTVELGLTYAFTQWIVYPLPHDKRRLFGLYAASAAVLLLGMAAMRLPHAASIAPRALLLAAFAGLAWRVLLSGEDRRGVLRTAAGLADKARGKLRDRA